MLSLQKEMPMVTELNEKTPLYAILALLEKDQDGELELSLEDHEKISLLLRSKVDGCALFMTELDSECERLKKLAKSFGEAAKSTEKKMERFEKYIHHVLKSNSIKRLVGEAFELKDVEGREKVSVSAELTPDMEMEYPEFVRVKTEWSLTSIKDALKAGRDLSFASLTRENSAKFYIKKKG